MINQENFTYYLRYLSRLTDSKPILYKEIPREFLEFFSVGGLSESLNINIRNPPPVNWTKVEKYIEDNTFNDFNSLAQGIKDNFQTPMDKLYAVYYYATHHIQYDWARFLMKERDSMSIDEIFTTNKGVCAEYSDFFVALSKKVGITSKIMTILKFGNTSKGHGYEPTNPPTEPKRDHACVFVEIDGESFLSEPTWGAGPVDDNGVFSFSYVKSYFLIPYYLGCISHYPDYDKFTSYRYSFPFEKFTALNKISFSKEVRLESNPFLVIDVKDGKYEMQFSFLMPGNRVTANFFIMEGKEWKKRDSIFASFKCLERNLPANAFSYQPEEKRCRYKMSICFPENGQWRVEVYGDRKSLFDNYFFVKGAKLVLDHIPGDGMEEAGFKPITPLEGLSTVTKGFARIRFTVKLKRAELLIHVFKIKKGTFQRESEESVDLVFHTFATELPFESGDGDDRLVEDWVFVEFPENGRWEVYIYFKNDEGTYSYGVTYYFDVTGSSGDHAYYSISDVPKTREFVPFKTSHPDEVWTEPSTSVVVLKKFDFYFHVFSEKKLSVYFVPVNKEDSQTIYPTLLNEKETGQNHIVDREYSVSFHSKGDYDLNLWGEKLYGRQHYYVIDFDLHEESLKEKRMMNDIKNEIEGKIDYNDDIPLTVKRNVDDMLKEQILLNEEEEENKNENESENESESEETDIYVAEQKEINELTEKTSKLKQRNEMLQLRFDEMERRENLLKLDFVKQINQLRDDWEKKDKRLTEERLESSRRRKIEYEDMERREKLLTERKIANLNKRIRMIEEQLETDPDKRNELVQLQQQLIEEENNDVFTISARRQKRIDEERQEELDYEEMKANERMKKMKIIKELDEEIQKSVRGGEEGFRKEREKMKKTNKKKKENNEKQETKEENEEKSKKQKKSEPVKKEENKTQENEEIPTQKKSKSCILI